MEKPILSDKDQFPTEDVIFSHIGKSKIFWEELFSYVHSNFPEFNEEWRYYNDGKSWLLKITKKTKTVFWLSIIENSFKITFYFGDKAETTIMESTISNTLKESFKNGKRFGKIRGITVQAERQSDIDHIIKLIGIKLSLK